MTEIRKAETTDLPRLSEIQSTALAEYSPPLLEAAVDGPLSALVVADDEPLGYVIVLTDGSSVAYVPELAIAPDRQGESYGSRLLRALVNDLRAEGYAELRLTVRVVDSAAREFYAAHGFESRDRLPSHFEAGDGLLLVRPLEDR